MLAVALTALALAAPVGFHAAPALAPAASFVAGKPTPVFCADDFTGWLAAKQAQGFGSADVVAYTDLRGRPGIYVAPDLCASLPRATSGRSTASVSERAVA